MPGEETRLTVISWLDLENWMLDVYYILVSLEDKETPQIRAFHINEEGDITEDEFQLI